MTSRYIILLLGALAVLGRPAGAAPVPVTIDTSGLSGQTGFLDFQFSTDGSGSTPAASSVALDGSPLPAGSMLNNPSIGSELMQPITFGNAYTFTPTFTLTAQADEPSFLQLFLLDSTQTTLPTNDPDTSNAAAVLTVDPAGVLTTQTFTPLAVTAVPETGSATLLALGLLPLVAIRRRRA